MSLSKPIAPCARAGEPHWLDPTEALTAAELHERYAREVFRYVSRRVARQEEAEDITAEVFVSAFAGLGSFRGHCPAYLWLLTIARRKIIDAQRRRASRRETLASELADEAPAAAAVWQALAVSEGPEAALTQAEAGRVLRALIRELSADQREALLLKYWERLSVTEIATVMGRSAASVNSLLQRARATLYHRGRAYFLGEEEGKEP
jgi:RNA polymerase sigma-70 factor (ECF subfamily)